jgi:Uma2 family endonuclease
MNMKSVLNPSLKEIAAAAINQKLILQGVGWDFYERVLKEFADSNALHFAYNNGSLEVEVPTSRHEFVNRVLQDLVTFIALEIKINIRNAGSTTFRQETAAKGVEPDTCFYIQNASKMRGKQEIDLTTDPPPDLVIEVDVTSPSLEKLPIYAALKVPEVWLYKGKKVEFYKLANEKYQKIKYSSAFPLLSSEKVTEFLNKGLNQDLNEWVEEIRKWARDKR